MESNFEYAVREVLKHEGGYVNHKSDPGGATNYGISLRWLRIQADLDGLVDFDIDRDGDLDANDIKAMTPNDAQQFYFKYWWRAYGYQRITDVMVASKTFDLAINMGAKQAHKLLQRACVTCGIPVQDDGVFGAATASAVNNCDAGMLIGALRTEAKYFYLGLIDKQPDFLAFKTGWLTRAIA